MTNEQRKAVARLVHHARQLVQRVTHPPTEVSTGYDLDRSIDELPHAGVEL